MTHKTFNKFMNEYTPTSELGEYAQVLYHYFEDVEEYEWFNGVETDKERLRGLKNICKRIIDKLPTKDRNIDSFNDIVGQTHPTITLEIDLVSCTTLYINHKRINCGRVR